ncbi:MAG: flagellar filament capping protein FliD [Dorea sp.]|nr:flagellar filament capping protein FliD [Dorea sp.]
MASVSSTGSSYSSLSSQIRGYGGLASGLDRDTLIEQMTSGTRAKIAKQKQEQTKISWKQEAMRDITSKIYNFTSNYASYSSANNLLSSNLFSRNQVTAVGENSKYISVSGTAASAENMSIARVKQLASNASLTTGKVTDQLLKTKAMGLADDGTLSKKTDVSTIAGDAIYIKYGNQNYTVKLADTDEYNYLDPQEAMKAINEQLSKINIGSGTDAQTLGDVLKVEMDGDKVKFTVDESKAHGNTVKLAGGTGDVLKDLGFLKSGQDFDELKDEEKTITGKGLTGSQDAKLTEEKTLAQRLSNARITFSYNGQSKTIELDKFTDKSTMENVQKDLQDKLNTAFGKGRVQVIAEKDVDGKYTGELSFKTVRPKETVAGEVKADESSVLSVVGGSGVLGANGVFGIQAGTSNRVNMSANLANAGFSENTANEIKRHEQEEGKYLLKINGKEVEGITKDSTIKEIVEKINSTEGIGVSVAYQEMSNRFVIKATENGTSGEIKFDDDEDNIAKYLFGEPNAASGSGIPKATYTEGKDAVLMVKYPGSDEEIEITRGSNTFSLDGLDVTLKGTFGYKEDGTVDSAAEAVTFNADVDTDKAIEAVKGMIDSYNEILSLVNSHVSTKPARDSSHNKYEPLTDEQKAEMSESQIEMWEEKAKQGILFADSDLRMMANNLRTIINSGNSTALSSMGITVSSNYADNGKLVFDEAKFKTALQKDPEAVKQAFTKAVSKDENGNTQQGGLMVTMKGIMDKYGSMTGSTKGILVERAGSIHAPTTITGNSYQKQLDRLDDYISQLQNKLKTETDRYISQFTSLETLISQMNSQSSYLSSLFA